LDDAKLAAFRESFTKEYLNIGKANVEELYNTWSDRDPKFFGKVASPLVGIRCLRQDPWECTLSFICSQNNNIKRITSLVKAIRNNFGERICSATVLDKPEDIYAFPSFDAFKSKVTEAKLRQLGFGYRAPYIIKSAKLIADKGGEEWLNGLRGKPADTVRDELT
jgi:N-glycosylase/DNA lyase